MTTIEFQTLRKVETESPRPFMVARPGEIRNAGITGDGVGVIQVQGVELPVSGDALLSLDKYAGLTQDQKKVVSKAGGQLGLRDMRNYLTTARGSLKNDKLVLLLDPHGQRVVDVRPLVGQIIPMKAFMQIAEWFMDQNGLLPDSFEKGDLRYGFTLKMVSTNPQIRSIMPGDDAILGAFNLKWNLTQISVELMMQRVVCSNGARVTLADRHATIHDLTANSVESLLSVPKDGLFLSHSWDEYRKKAVEANAVKASLAEVMRVNKRLQNYGIAEDACNQVAPYPQDLKAYMDNGILERSPMMKEAQVLASSVSAWDLYNNMTAFATHTNLLREHSPYRGQIRYDAAQFLAAPRDIKHYVDIFSGRR